MKALYVPISDVTLTLQYICFIVTLFIYWEKAPSISLLKGHTLKSSEEHFLYSFFIVSGAALFFGAQGLQIGSELIALQIDVIDRRKLFYLALMCNGFLYLLTLYVVHRIKGCSFSREARAIMYLVLTGCSLNFTQLVLRGYLDIHVLYEYNIYGIAIVIVNTLALYVLAGYPVRYLYGKFIAIK